MKGNLHRLELSVARIEAAVSNLATKADVAALSEKVSAQGERLTKVEDAIEQTIILALSKTISPWQVPAILAVCVALIGILMAAFNWAGHQPWFPH